MTSFAPIADADCPLLIGHGGDAGRGLVGRYAAALARVDGLAADPAVSGLGAAGKLDGAAGHLAAARAKLTRQKYVVGFIGLTQAGKSTTVNTILAEEVCKSGTGDATSSQPARLVHAAGRSLDTEYLTPARYAARRQKLCEEIGLSSPDPDDAKLLAQLAQPALFADAGADRPRLKDDLVFLKQFLDARRAHGRLLTDPPRAEAGLPYAERYAVTVHARAGDGAGKELLLREARFHLDNPNLPAELELCDLPGLDSKRSIDDIVTAEYLPDLDGTFLFVNVAMNLNASGMRRALGMVARAFAGSMAGRAWVIFTKMDSLTEHHFRAGGEDNVFGIIDRLLAELGIPPAQVCFCSNEVYKATHKLPAADRAPRAADMLKQPPAAPVPAVCPPALRPAWEALLSDGGIGRVRGLMTGGVAAALAGEIRRDAARLLDQFDDEFESVVSAEKARAAGGSDLLEKVATCRYVVMELADRLGRRPDQYPALAAQHDALRAALGAVFDDDKTIRVVTGLATPELVGEFRGHARLLTQTLQARLAGGLIDAVYKAVAADLDGLPAVPLGRHGASCADAWAQFTRADRGGAWLAAGPAFDSAEVVRLLTDAGPDGLDGAAYLDLMRAKVVTAVHQALHAVAAQVRGRLREIQADLRRLATDEPAAAPRVTPTEPRSRAWRSR